MKLKNLFAAAAVAAGLCLTGMSAVQAAPKMPESISITYVKSPFNLQNIVMKERGMLEDAFKAEGVKINWRVINSGAIQGQAMASGDLDFSAVMNTASVLMAAGAGNPIRIASGVGHPQKIFAIIGKPGTDYSIKDLKGKTLSVGAPGGTMHLDFFRWVEANGLDPKKDFGKVLFLPASEAMEAVKTGQVDVAVELSSIPSPQISELSILRPVHILEFLPGARADMMQKYPQYLPTTIEKGAYNGIDQPIETVGTGAMFACRADLPDDLVYEIVKTVYSQEGVDYLGNVIAALKSMSPNLAVSYKPIPLHPGAERYFREIGLIKD